MTTHLVIADHVAIETLLTSKWLYHGPGGSVDPDGNRWVFRESAVHADLQSADFRYWDCDLEELPAWERRKGINLPLIAAADLLGVDEL